MEEMNERQELLEKVRTALDGCADEQEKEAFGH